MGTFKDLSGLRFGNLVVISKSDQPNNIKDKHSYWLCQCDCGNQVSVVGTSLTRGDKKSCGCIGHSNMNNLTGKRFGYLTVIQRANKPEGVKNRNVYWLCKCDCGNEKIIQGACLKNGDTVSCGCMHGKTPKKHIPG